VEAGQRQRREGPSLQKRFRRSQGEAIGDEPGNAKKDPDASEELYRKAKDEPHYRFYLAGEVAGGAQK
jgi:hypothetical protein